MTSLLRQKLDQHSGLVIAICLLVVLGVVGLLGFPSLKTALRPEPKPATGAYFYDLQTAELIVLPTATLAPSQNPENKDAQRVWAHQFSCTSCQDTSSRFTGYLLAMTPTYLLAAQSAKNEIQRRSFRVPGTLPDSFQFPAPVPAPPPAKGFIKAPDMFLIADPPASPGAKINWRPLTPPSLSSETDKLKSRCSGELLKTCTPD